MAQNCPVCASQVSKFRSLKERDEAEIECPKCGFLKIDGILMATKIPDRLRAGICIYLRRCFEEKRLPETIPDVGPDLERLAETYQSTSVEQKLTYLLRLLSARSKFPGDSVPFSFERDHPAIAAINSKEAEYLVWSLQQQGLIEGSFAANSQEGQQIIIGRGLQLTPHGWTEVQASPDPANSGRCFVAMAFDDAMNATYDTAIKPAIELDAGFEAVMMRDVPHTEKICDRILAEIKRCQFVVADVTYHKQNVYFEAGFAMGMNRPVIWTCRADHFEEAKFDTRQYFHISWKDAGDLRTQLRDRILATIGHRPN